MLSGLLIKKELSRISNFFFSKGIEVRGALRVNLMFNSDWHVKYSMIMIEILLFCLIWYFWKFPETAWQVMNCRQATHPFSRQFRVLVEEPPAY